MTTINFSVIKNDTLDFAWTMTFLKNDVAIDLTDAEIKADFKTSVDATSIALTMRLQIPRLNMLMPLMVLLNLQNKLYRLQPEFMFMICK